MRTMHLISPFVYVQSHVFPRHHQHLIERSWYAVTETCLAFTVFRDDFSPRFVALFTLLLFLKCFHWLAEDRVDFVSDEGETTSSSYVVQSVLNPYTGHCLKVERNRWYILAYPTTVGCYLTLQLIILLQI